MVEIGPVCHTRWLTTALLFCRIWVSNYALTGTNLENLKIIVNFIVIPLTNLKIMTNDKKEQKCEILKSNFTELALI